MSHIPKIPQRDDPPRWRRPAGPIPPQPPTAAPREPMLTMPTSVIVMIALMGIIHLVRDQLTYRDDLMVLAWFAFIPARYSGEWSVLPGGIGADVWTFVTYALLHGSMTHIITNCVWLLAFGSAVARRFGAWRFWVFSGVCAAGGAGLHLLFHPGDAVPMVGASAAISGQMAGAVRFVFDDGGPLVFRRSGDLGRFRRPARPLAAVLTNKKALAFIVIWFAINLAVGLGSAATGAIVIAWEAHLGGFLVGLLAFRLFDPVPR